MRLTVREGREIDNDNRETRERGEEKGGIQQTPYTRRLRTHLPGHRARGEGHCCRLTRSEMQSVLNLPSLLLLLLLLLMLLLLLLLPCVCIFV